MLCPRQIALLAELSRPYGRDGRQAANRFRCHFGLFLCCRLLLGRIWKVSQVGRVSTWSRHHVAPMYIH